MAYRTAYAAEDVTVEAFKNFLDDYWDSRINNDIPKPEFIIPNEEKRVNLKKGDICVIRLEAGGVKDTQRGNWSYKDVIAPVVCELYTWHSKQRLHDLKQEIIRICYDKKHDMDEYQLVRFVNFRELTDETVNVWAGEARISLESNGVYVSCTGGT